jgi:hypothetical protein
VDTFFTFISFFDYKNTVMVTVQGLNQKEKGGIPETSPWRPLSSDGITMSQGQAWKTYPDL